MDEDIALDPVRIKMVSQAKRRSWSVLQYYDNTAAAMTVLLVDKTVEEILADNPDTFILANAGELGTVLLNNNAVTYSIGNDDGSETLFINFGYGISATDIKATGLLNAQTFDVTLNGLNVSLNAFTASGNHTTKFIAGQPFIVTQSTNGLNDGLFTTVSSAHGGGTTTIVVRETIPGGTLGSAHAEA